LFSWRLTRSVVTAQRPRKPEPADSDECPRRSSTPAFDDIAGLSLVALGLILFSHAAVPAQTGETFRRHLSPVCAVRGLGAWAFPSCLSSAAAALALGKVSGVGLDNIGGAVAAFFIYLRLGGTWALRRGARTFRMCIFNCTAASVGAGIAWCLRSAVARRRGIFSMSSVRCRVVLWITDIPLPTIIGRWSGPVSGAQRSAGAKCGGRLEAVRDGRRERREQAEEARQQRQTALLKSPLQGGKEGKTVRTIASGYKPAEVFKRDDAGSRGADDDLFTCATIRRPSRA
jgi:hypothetical protein